ncbi:MAG: OmpA family protein, partial [Spirochaetota bacterium]
QGGDGYAAPAGDGKAKPAEPSSAKGDTSAPAASSDTDADRKYPTRPVEISVKNETGEIPARVDVKKWENGKLVYSETVPVNRHGTISVPQGDNVEITASAPGHMPEKITLGGSDPQADITLRKIEKGKSYVADAVQFEYNKAYLRRQSLGILDGVVRMMKENPSLKCEVRGHTDSTGDAAYNMKLSERRADAVKEYMIKNGISPERLMSKGFGSTVPAAPNDTEQGRAKNRRTEFIFR